MQEKVGEVEENTGIEIGGNKSLEHYLGSALTLEDRLFINEAIVVEVADGE